MSVIVSAEVERLLDARGPVVALETAVITNGLPRCTWNKSFGDNPTELDDTLPINFAVSKAITKAVKHNGACPAWVSVIDGSLHVGTSQEHLENLTKDEDATKVSLSNISQVMQSKMSAGTTVATTLLACLLANKNHPIRVFATGGIGGIHQNWNKQLDVSADLRSLATTPTCVVASGAKSILDLHATVEALETIGVPLLGLQCNRFPRFIEQTSDEDPSIQEIETEEEVASICNMHWNELQMQSAVIAAVPVPSEFGLPRNALKQHVEEAEVAWRTMNLTPATRTPFVLDYLVVQTQGDSLRANIALLLQNASKAAKVACAISNSM